MMQWGAPGAQYTRGNRLTRLMSGPEMERLNDGTIAGGLAYALSRGFQAHQQARDQRMQQAADQAFTQGLAGGDLAGAIQALQGMEDNPYAQGRLTQALLAQSGQQREQAQQEAQWAREDERFGQRMAAQDQQWQQRFAAEQAARTQQAEADRAFRERMFGLEQAAENRGAFAGTSMDAQARNILLSADPGSQEYAMAYSYVAQPRTVFQNGQMVTIRPDMSRIAPPAGTRTAGRPSLTAGAAPLTGGTPQAPFASGSMSQAPQQQPAYFAPAQAAAEPPTGQQIAPGVTVTPMADPEADRKRTDAAETERRTANIVTQDIDRALSLLDEGAALPMTGFVGNLTSNIGGTPQYDLNALLDTVRANIGFAALQEMRANSPTGGALGQVSEFENRLLQATQGNLAIGQTEEQLRRNLGRVREFYNEVLGGPVPTPQQVELALRKLEEGIAPPGGQMGRTTEGAVPAGVDPQDWQYMTPEERALFQ